VSVALRDAAPALAKTLKLMVALPEPLLGGVSVSQGALLVATQEQAVPDVDSCTLPLPPKEGWNGLLADTVKLQVTPASEMLKGTPPISASAARADVVEFGAIEKLALPLPLPVPPTGDVTEIQLGPGSTVQAQPTGAVTLTLATSPAALMETPALLSEYVQLAPAWFTVYVLFAIVRVPVWLPAGLGSTFTVTPPEPVPPAGPEIESHGSLETAVQGQPEADAVTLTSPEPPDALTEDDPGEMLNPHEVPN